MAHQPPASAAFPVNTLSFDLRQKAPFVEDSEKFRVASCCDLTHRVSLTPPMKPPFLISCCSLALRNLPVFEAVEKIAQAGFPGVELWDRHIDKLDTPELQALRKRCEDLNLVMTVVAPYFSFTRGSEATAESFQIAERVLASARVLGIKKIRTFTDCGPDGVRSSLALPVHWRDAVASLKKLCAMDRDAEFVLETHELTLANNLRSVHRILNEVAAPNLRINYQATPDFLQAGYFACLQELLPFITHMHWDQVPRDGKGPAYIEEPGVINFRELICFLREQNYQGTASVEYCWADVPEERLASAWKFLAGMLE